MTNDEIESLLKTAGIARFCSLNRDGTIHAVPVWYKYENGIIWIATPEASHKAKNVKRNNKVSVLIEDQKSTRAAIIYGNAELAPSPVGMADAVSLSEKYVPREDVQRYARGVLELANWVKIGVKPKRIVSFDSNKDEAIRAAVQG